MEARQPSLDRNLFDPGMAVRAMRDSRYRTTSHAIAEIIDNSIDAHASNVEIMIEERQERARTNNVWRVERIAVSDDGRGMDASTLVEALRFGGRVDSGLITDIGKYGMGLPTASVSQCKRLDVWSWRDDGRTVYSFIDVEAAEQGEWLIPEPTQQRVPSEWRERIANYDPRQGTLVVWSKLDRVTSRAETIFTQIERDTGRIYRHFIHNGEVSIRLARFRADKLVDGSDRILRPNDPLYLMPNSSTPEPWAEQPMFVEHPNTERNRQISVTMPDGSVRDESVDIIYSWAKPEARDVPDGARRAAGLLAHGQHAKRNEGISIVRENRELLLDRSLYAESGTAEDTRNRWWGCEIRFTSGCDDLFGVDHNKQMAAMITSAAKDLDELDANSDEELEQVGQDGDQVYEMVSAVRATIRSMRREIDRRNRQRGTSRGGQKNGRRTPAQKAEDAAGAAIEDEIKDYGGPVTETDRQHSEASAESRREGVTAALKALNVENAEERAREIVMDGSRFTFLPVELDGFQMFNVRLSDGTIIVGLGIGHELYKLLQFLENNDEQLANQAATALRILVLAWARMEDQTSSQDERRLLQTLGSRWGRQASLMLSASGVTGTPDAP